MRAYVKTIENKTTAIKNAKRHREQDMLISGTYQQGKGKTFKGCSVGCMYKPYEGKILATSLHGLSEPVHGIPEWLTRVRDTIFEGLPRSERNDWHVNFHSAINVGADLDKIKGEFLVGVLQNVLKTFDHKQFPDVKVSIQLSIKLWKRKDIGSPAFKKAANAARSAANAAERAADAAGAAAYARSAANAARSAANAARSAAYAAYAVDAGARSAANAAERAAYAAGAAAYAAGAAAYVKFAKDLIKLIKGCK